jgi:cobalamin biosynthesis protein CobT
MYPTPHAERIVSALRERTRLMERASFLESDSGKLNTRRLARVFAQPERPFCFMRKYGRKPAPPSTHVAVLLDQSGSLKRVYKTLYTAAAPLLQALFDAGIGSTIATHAQGFRDRQINEKRSKRLKAKCFSAKRFSEYIHVYPGHDASAVVDAMLAVFERHSRDGDKYSNILEEWNDDTAALLWAKEYMSDIDADRKIVFLLTDGVPTNANKGVYNTRSWRIKEVNREFKETVSLLDTEGITVYGVYIDTGCSECPIDLYPPGRVSTANSSAAGTVPSRRCVY